MNFSAARQDKVPVPCTEEFMDEVRAWQDINEDEDEEAMKLQYYGITDIEGITGKVRATDLTRRSSCMTRQ